MGLISVPNRLHIWKPLYAEVDRDDPLSNGFVCLWPFNEGSGNKVFDLSGNGNDGAFGAGAASPIWVPGKFGPCLSFDGGDYIQIDDTFYDSGTPTQITISIWVYSTSYTINEIIIMRDFKPFNIQITSVDGSGNANFKTSVQTDGTGYIQPTTTGEPLLINKWHNIVLRYDGVTCKAFLNGLEVKSANGTGNLLTDSGEDIAIGASNNFSQYFFTGLLDIPAIWNRALSFSEIALLLYREPFRFLTIPRERAMFAKKVVGVTTTSTTTTTTSTTTTTTTTSTTTTTTTTSTTTTTTTTSTTTTTTTTSTTTTTTSTTTTTTTTTTSTTTTTTTTTTSTTTTTTTSTTTTTTSTTTTSTTTTSTTTTGVSIATSNIHIFSDDNDIEPNHATDNKKSVLIKDGLEVQGNIWGGGASNYTKIDSSGNVNLFGNANVIFQKASGNGIKVDTATPTFGWRDLEGFEIPDPTGGDRPTLSTYSGGLIKENAFSNGDVLRIRYHIPHDYVKGTDILSHIHWSHNGTAISGNVVFGVTSDYAKGHNQANFGTEKSISITYATTDISTTPRYRHRIEESVITNDGGSATLIDRGLLEPDGIILVTFEVTTNPTITGGSPNNVFVHRADLHYQSTNIATKQKVPDFYT